MALSPELRSWVGRTRVAAEEVTLGTVRRIAGMLDLDPEAFKAGDVLPPHWFTLFAAETPRQSDLGPDGHPNPGVVLPPIPLPRRMGAGRRVRIPGALRIGDTVERTASVAAIVPKQAKTGFITVLTMRHSYRTEGALVAVDEFDAIYREAVPPGTKSPEPAPQPAPAEAAWRETVRLDPTLVFRYSALTWNAHRIHYDADYARGEEGYPDAVQNGGLTMHLVVEAALRHLPGRLTGFTARLTRPLYVGQTVTLAGARPDGGPAPTSASAWAADEAGNLCGQIELEFG